MPGYQKRTRERRARSGSLRSTRVPNLSAPVREMLEPFELSDREAQAALALMARLTVSETASRFRLSRSAVGTYRKRLFAKLGVDDEAAAREKLVSAVGDIDLVPDEDETTNSKLRENSGLGSACVGISLVSLATQIVLLVYGASGTTLLLRGQGRHFAVAGVLAGLLMALGSRFTHKRVTAWDYEAVAAVCGLMLVIISTRLFTPSLGTLSWHAAKEGFGWLVWMMMLIGLVGLLLANIAPPDTGFSPSISFLSGAIALFGYSALGIFGVRLGLLAIAASVAAAFSTIARLRCLPFVPRGGRNRRFDMQWGPVCLSALGATAGCFAFVAISIMRSVAQSSFVVTIASMLIVFILLLGFAAGWQRLESRLVFSSDATVLLLSGTLLAGGGCGGAFAGGAIAFKWEWWAVLALGIVCAAAAWVAVERVVRLRVAYMTLDRAEAAGISLARLGIMLTPTEKVVVSAVADGLNAKEIARWLVVSRATVNSHLYHVFKKCDVSTIEELRAVVEHADELYCGEGLRPN